jgi:SNF2 family DNA or RNA helicase
MPDKIINLHEYQQQALEFIKTINSGALFLDPGLGKTLICLELINQLKYDYFDMPGPVLIIAPKRVAEHTWIEELNKWGYDLKMSVVVGDVKTRKKALSVKADIYVINRENIIWLILHYNKQLPFKFVILDELSSFKASSSKRFKALKKYLNAERVIGLTATPTSNGYLDLWSQIYLLDKGCRLERSMTAYRGLYFTPDKFKGHIVYSYKLNEGSEERINNKISDICLSMRGINCNIPECINSTITVYMSEAEKAIYKDMKKDMLLEYAQGDVIALNKAVLTNKLLQMANGAVYDEFGNIVAIHDRKLDALEDIVEAANGNSILVFYAYKHDCIRIKQRFNTAVEFNYLEWNKGKQLIALVHPASCGHGLNLQSGGHIVVWYGLTWSLENYIQANRRLYRQGQKHIVSIIHIATDNTIDIQVLEALQDKGLTRERLLKAIEYNMKGVV